MRRDCNNRKPDCNDSVFEKYENAFEWLQFCEEMTDKITWYMAVRESDGKVVGFIVFRHKLEIKLQCIIRRNLSIEHITVKNIRAGE